MKIPVLSTFTFLALVGVNSASAWNFTYTYQTVNSANSSNYIVGMQHIQAYNEWTGSSYWGPNANDVQATITSKFTFSAASTEIFLNTRLQAYNWAGNGRSDYGFTSLWGSTDGSNWQLIVDDPTPAAYGAVNNVVYNQDLPSNFLGNTTLWLQVRMQQHAAPLFAPGDAAGFTDSQYSRYDGPGINPPSTGNIFELDANVVPEPVGWQLIGLGLGMSGYVFRRKRR
ncbi:MAG: hypothetical protein C5B50_09535 [Verrucomicrobia bacterium]|nr:MAG: hypothetical protein C5B50_09535 [Verrucomicrobiota bacterium]